MNKSKEVYYFDYQNKLIKEKNNVKSLITFIYNSRLGNLLRTILNKSLTSQFYGILQKNVLSKFKIKKFIKKYNIDVSEFEKNVSEFKTFNDFFIRKLKPSCRLIDKDENVLISPADSKLFVIPKVSKEVKFFVKEHEFNLEKFIKDKQLAQDYQNGTMMIFRLAPYDYHRFHFPFDCVASESIVVNGLYDSVNPIVYKSGVLPLTENERKIIKLKSERFTNPLMIIVGAMFVGKIQLTYDSQIEQKKGSECGYFEFGASSIVLLFKQDSIKLNQNFIQNSLNGFETAVRIGQGVAQILV